MYSLFDDFSALGIIGQAQHLFAGSVFALAAAILLCREALWRLRARRVQGVIAGVRARSRVYYTVYDFVTAEGLACRATARTGSSLTGGRETGKAVELFYFPHDPLYIRRADSWLALALALGCLIAATLFLRTAFGNPEKLLYAACFVPLLAGLWLWFSLRPPTDEEKKRLGETHASRDTRLGPVIPIETLLDQSPAAPWTPVPAFLPHLVYLAAAVLAGYALLILVNTADMHKAGLACGGAAILIWIGRMAQKDRKRWEKNFGNGAPE